LAKRKEKKKEEEKKELEEPAKKKPPDDPKRKKRGGEIGMGYNWRKTLIHFASISGILAGFCVTFIAFILGGPVADIEICTSGVSFGQVAVLLFGISTGLFIYASELFC